LPALRREASDVTVRLTPAEMMIGASVGVMRRLKAIQLGQRGQHGREDGGEWQADIESALAEMALAKHLGVYWAPSCGGPLDTRDVGGREVRHTERDDGCLLIRDCDSDDAPFYLVTGRMGVYEIRGHLERGADGKQESYRRAPNGRAPAYFVPQRDLINEERTHHHA